MNLTKWASLHSSKKLVFILYFKRGSDFLIINICSFDDRIVNREKSHLSEEINKNF